ncbi:MAG: PTS sugar transporter subunit IIC, partial [Bacillota bacterium]|nr:PTS sugar transporter subunit IIC [Bacillota bacterium]
AGAVLGDVSTGAMVGALCELSFTGLAPIGGASIPDGLTCGIMASVLAISQKLSVTEAYALSLPFCYLRQYIGVLKNSIFPIIFNQRAEDIAETGDTKRLLRLHFFTLGLQALIASIVIFVCAYAAKDAIGAVVGSIPQWLMHGLSLAGGMMPAVGFSMMLAIVFKIQYLPFLITGFVISCYLNAGVMPIALLAASAAIFYYFFINDGSESAKGGSENDGI